MQKPLNDPSVMEPIVIDSGVALSASTNCGGRLVQGIYMPAAGPIETAEITLSAKEYARRLMFLLAEAQEQAKEQQDQDVEKEAS
jgi:hypothetical protein